MTWTRWIFFYPHSYRIRCVVIRLKWLGWQTKNCCHSNVFTFLLSWPIERTTTPNSMFDYVHLALSYSSVGCCYWFWFGNRENGAPSEFMALLIDRSVWIRRMRDRLQPHYHFSLWGRTRHSLNSVCKWVFNASQPHSCNQNMEREKKRSEQEILHTFLNVPPADMYAYISYCHRLHIVCYLHRYSVAGVALTVVCYGYCCCCCCCCKI